MNAKTISSQKDFPKNRVANKTSSFRLQNPEPTLPIKMKRVAEGNAMEIAGEWSEYSGVY